MGGQLHSLYTSVHASRIKRLTAYLPLSIRRCYNEGKKESNSNSGHGIDEERAPSTAEEFRRVAEEKSRQGFASHTLEKAGDGSEEVVTGDGTLECVKEAHKGEPPGKGDFHKTGDDG